ncbi:hypothetical protein RCH23_001888 [Cryobacterium sp. CAN_C3]|uniref:hypothetical protein n=1 Tax=unclassified Cryobacterium TaxID=2649013 RepID=UPI0018CA17C4|nr:hypothetical protein [Cryobacterium sp. CAN_C3]MEC5154507.1 hypothetical protein [Cryobacterium sp. CAN_C3]
MQLVADVDCQAPNLHYGNAAQLGAPLRTDVTTTHPDTPITVELDGCQPVFLPGSHALVPAPALLAALVA